jgi:hypothetical protein
MVRMARTPQELDHESSRRESRGALSGDTVVRLDAVARVRAHWRGAPDCPCAVSVDRVGGEVSLALCGEPHGRRGRAYAAGRPRAAVLFHGRIALVVLAIAGLFGVAGPSHGR